MFSCDPTLKFRLSWSNEPAGEMVERPRPLMSRENNPKLDQISSSSNLPLGNHQHPNSPLALTEKLPSTSAVAAPTAVNGSRGTTPSCYSPPLLQSSCTAAIINGNVDPVDDDEEEDEEDGAMTASREQEDEEMFLASSSIPQSAQRYFIQSRRVEKAPK